MEATYFWDCTFFPFFTGWVVQHHRQCIEPCQMAEVFVGLGTFRDRKKRDLKKMKGGSMSPPVVSLSHCMVSHIQQPHRSCFMCSR